MTLGEVASNISEPFDFRKNQRVILINTGDVYEGKFFHKDYSDINSLLGQAKKAIRPNDILLSEIRPANRRFSYVDFEASDYVVSTKFMVIRAKKNILYNYLYLFLKSSQTLNELQRIAEYRSGTFPQITFDSIRFLPFTLPPLAEQKAIARILSSLDDKIELNQEMNRLTG